MLDSFEILTTSGVVLWSKHYVPVSSNIVNALITDVFIEEKASASSRTGGDGRAARNPPYKKEKYTLKFTTAKDIGLIFVAVYQSLLSLSWVDSLLDVVRAIFIQDFSSNLKKTNRSKLDYSPFDRTFDALVAKLDKTSSSAGPTARPSDTESVSDTQLTPPSSSAGTEDGSDEPLPPPAPDIRRAAPKQTATETSTADHTPLATPDTSRPSSPAVGHLLSAKAGPGGKLSRRAKKALGSSAPTSSGDESTTSRKSLGARKASGKAKRRWDADGFAAEEDEDQVLDYSAQGNESLEDNDVSNVEDVRSADMGSRTSKGQFVLKDLDDEVDAIIAESKARDESSVAQSSGLLGSSVGAISGYFKNIVGGKTLTKQDLEKPLKNLEDHLLQKNVAREAAVRLCESVERDLLGVKTANFTSIDATLRASLSTALTRMLTPTTSLDLLRAINTTTTSPLNPRPYVISIVGVNGVGKSTNLSKLAYFLLQNSYRVLICAADTFRSGAVEQLRVHVRNLSELSRRENVGYVELFEKGYGKDAAVIARDAVRYANEPSPSDAGGGDKKPAFDVVLIDTAGRRHNDARLMSNLTKFGQLADPDKIFMVGEALVGTDSVAQARNFSAQFVDAKGRGRGLDGFIISKCDTVGDMVGTLVSMVHATGIPVVFLGVGQHYGDLRGLNVGWAVEKLMK